MKKYKVILLIILALLSLASVVFLLILPKKQVVPQVPAVLPTPNIPSYVKGQISFEFKINKTDWVPPEKVAYLRQVPKQLLTQEKIKAIAGGLGFTQEPTSSNDIKMGPVYFYNSANNFLIVYPQIQKIKYGPASSPINKIETAINKQLTDKELITLGEDFLINKIGLTRENIKFNNFVYLKNAPGLELFKETNKDSVQIFQLNYIPAVAKYPILTLNPQQTTAYVQILKDGTILNSEVIFTGELSLSENEYPIKSLEGVEKEINQAVLVSLNDSNINLPDLKEGAISKIIIEKVSLLYLLDKPLANKLLPVFLLEGRATVQDYTNSLNVSLYLPAYP